MNINELQQLKERIGKAKSTLDVARGRLESIKGSIEEKGFGSIKELKTEIDRLDVEIADASLELQKRIADWKEQYGELIGN